MIPLDEQVSTEEIIERIRLKNIRKLECGDKCEEFRKYDICTSLRWKECPNVREEYRKC